MSNEILEAMRKRKNALISYRKELDAEIRHINLWIGEVADDEKNRQVPTKIRHEKEGAGCKISQVV